MSEQGFSTRAIHAGYHPDPQTGAVNVPIYASSTFKQDGVAAQQGVPIRINYSAAEARAILGLPSGRIAERLGYLTEPELIHRDNLVLLG